jgi:hypothetical protein
VLAYIDESGDEGTLGNGSRWLVFGCVMVPDTGATTTRAVAQSACIAIGTPSSPKWVHFDDLDHDGRHVCLEIFDEAPWDAVIVASDTTSVRAGSILYKPVIQYRYPAMYTVERISARAVELGEQATIYFEHRNAFDLIAFRDYVRRVLSNGSSRLDARVIDPARIHLMPKGNDPILCIADAVAFAGSRVLNGHRKWRRYEPSYFGVVEPRLWRGPTGRENVHAWGLVLMPTDQWGGRFAKEYPWILQLRAK